MARSSSSKAPKKTAEENTVSTRPAASQSTSRQARTAEYELLVCGVKVTSENCKEIHKYFDHTRDNIDGTAEYDPLTKVLTLSGNFSYIHGEPDAAIYSEIEGLTINIAGGTTVSAACYAISMRSSGVITGKGTLVTDGEIAAAGDMELKIKDISVEVNGGSGGIKGYGITDDGAYPKLSISNSGIGVKIKSCLTGEGVYPPSYNPDSAIATFREIELQQARIISPEKAEVISNSNGTCSIGIKGIPTYEISIIPSPTAVNVRPAFSAESTRPQPEKIYYSHTGSMGPIEFEYTSANIYTGEEFQIKLRNYEIKDQHDYDWISGDRSIAYVTSLGKVKARGAGTTKITVRDPSTGKCSYFPVMTISGRPYFSPGLTGNIPIVIADEAKKVLQYRLKVLSAEGMLIKLSDPAGYEAVQRLTNADENTIRNWFRQSALWLIPGMSKGFGYFAASAGIRNISDLSHADVEKVYEIFRVLYSNGLLREEGVLLKMPDRAEIQGYIDSAATLNDIPVDKYNITIGDDPEPEYLFDYLRNVKTESKVIRDGLDFLKNIKLALPLPKVIIGRVVIKQNRNTDKNGKLEGYLVTLSGITSGTTDTQTDRDSSLSGYTDTSGRFIIQMPDIYSMQEVLTFTISGREDQRSNLLTDSLNAGTVTVSMRRSAVLDNVYRMIKGKEKKAIDMLNDLDELKAKNEKVNEMEKEFIARAIKRDPELSSKPAEALRKHLEELRKSSNKNDQTTEIAIYDNTLARCRKICETIIGIDYNTNDIGRSILSFLEGTFESNVGELLAYEDAFQVKKPYASTLPSVRLMGNDESPVILPTDTAPSRVFNYSIMYRLVAPAIRKKYEQGSGARGKIAEPLDVMKLKDNISYSQDDLPYACSLGMGYALNMHQAWVPDGFALGDLLYSLILAPGEEQRVIIREHNESYTVQDDAYARDDLRDTYTNSQIDNENAAFQNAIGRFSNAHSDSQYRTTAESSGGTRISLGIKKGIFGIGANSTASSTNTGMSSANAYQSDTYDEVSSAAQEFQSSIKTESERIAAARRTSISIASSDEKDSISSKIIANHNHSHVMTVQYWEVMRRYRMETAIESIDLVLYVPMKLINFMPTVKSRSVSSNDISSYTIINPHNFTKTLLTKRYSTLLENADILLNYLPAKYRGGLELIRRYAALPEWDYAEYSKIETEYTIQVTGGFLSCDHLTAEVYFNEGKMPVTGQIISQSHLELDPSLNTREDVIYGIKQTRKGMYASKTSEKIGAKYETKKFLGFIPYSVHKERHSSIDLTENSSIGEDIAPGNVVFLFSIPEGYTKNDISHIVIRNNYGSWNHRLSQKKEYMEDYEVKAIEKYEEALFNFSKDDKDSAGDQKRIDHYYETLPESYRKPDVTFTSGELSACGDLAVSVTLDSSDQEKYYSISSNGLKIDLGRKKPVLTYREIAEMEETFRHIGSNTMYYSQAIWSSLDYNELVMLLEGYTLDLSDGDNNGVFVKSQPKGAAVNSGDNEETGRDTNKVPLLNCINITKPLGFYGNCMLFPFTYPREVAEIMGKTAGEIQNELYRYHANSFRSPLTYISVPTSGMVGEAVLSETNVSEKIDITRFWNWKDSDIDHIELNQNSLGTTSLLANAKTKDIDAPTIGVTPTAHIDPSNLAGALMARQQPVFADVLGTTDMRDVLKTADTNASAGREQVVRSTSELTKAALETLVSAGATAATGGLAGGAAGEAVTGILGALGKEGLGNADLGKLIKGGLSEGGGIEGIAKNIVGMIGGGEDSDGLKKALESLGGEGVKDFLEKFSDNAVNEGEGSLAENFSRSISELTGSKEDIGIGDIQKMAKEFCNENGVNPTDFAKYIGNKIGLF